MKKNSPLYNSEIDLIALLKIIYEGKVKILLITIISLLVGFGYNSLIPTNYLNSLTINPQNNNKFLKLANIQKLLTQKKTNISNPHNTDQTNLHYLAKFIDELSDYKEFLTNIKNTKKIQEYFSKINNQDQKKELFKYAKLLEIVKSKIDEEKYIINFEWHDPEEAAKILQDTLNLTSNNLKIDISNELKNSLDFKKTLILNEDRERLDYLKEQSAIAKELNIKDNQINNVVNYQSKTSLSINRLDTAYYLRGHKAIDKEIELIQNRDYQTLKLIEQEVDSFKKKNIIWVNYNVYLMDTKSLKNTKFILIISILLGLIAGVFYLLILKVFQSQTAFKKTR
tara:strand:- start:127 stop:1146 length:1020 start_codon:yes stop_codon:yes gene_type:complete